MQNLGFAFSLTPLIRLGLEDKGDVKGNLLKHLHLYNSHPYMSGPILGSVAFMEMATRGVDSTDIRAFIHNTMGPLAALGDSVFWGSLRPCVSFLGVAVALSGNWLAPLFVICLYNPLHFWFRTQGFIKGFQLGKGIIDYLASLNLQRLARILRWLSVVLIAYLAFRVSLSILIHSFSMEAPAGFIFFLPLFLIGWVTLRRQFSPLWWLYLALGLFIGVSI